MNLIIFRYEESETYEKKDDRDPKTLIFVLKQLINANNLQHSTRLTAKIVTSLVFLYCKKFLQGYVFASSSISYQRNYMYKYIFFFLFAQ